MIVRLAAAGLLCLAPPAAAQVSRPLRIHGHVELPPGCPQDGPVEILAREGCALAPLTGATIGATALDAAGNFELRLALADPGFFLDLSARWLDLPPLWIETRAGETAIEVVLLPELCGILRGSFRLPDDPLAAVPALAGSWVWIDGARLCAAEVDVDGAFELRAPAAELCGPLCARPHGYAPLCAAAVPTGGGEKSELVLPLVEPARLSGRLVDASRNAVAGVTLSVWHGAGAQRPLALDPWGDVQTATSGADGTFELDGLPPGELELHLADPRWRLAGERVRELAPGEQREGLELVLLRAASLRGVVVDEAALPVPGARVTAGRRDGLGGWMVALTDAQGRYAFDAALPGEYVLGASSEGRAAPAAGVVALGEGERRRANLVLGRGSLLRIELHEGEAPLAVRVTDALGFLRAEQRLWQGELELTLPPGSYRVALASPDGATSERRMVLTGRERRPCTLGL